MQLPEMRAPRALCFLLFAVCASGRPTQANPSSTVAASGPIPDRYSAVSSAVIQYRWFKFPALGVLTVNARKRHFALVGLSQLGINVFELSETGGRLQSRMPGELLKRHPEIASGAAADVRQMFFDLSPSACARQLTGIHDNAITFQQPAPGGTLEYRLDQKSGHLREKRFLAPGNFFSGHRVVWLVRYEGYAAVGQHSYPHVIRFKQRDRHYAITLVLKELRIKP